jgi:hypothetical protein
LVISKPKEFGIIERRPNYNTEKRFLFLGIYSEPLDRDLKLNMGMVFYGDLVELITKNGYKIDPKPRNYKSIAITLDLKNKAMSIKIMNKEESKCPVCHGELTQSEGYDINKVCPDMLTHNQTSQYPYINPFTDCKYEY